jgi:hypothetical protein
MNNPEDIRDYRTFKGSRPNCFKCGRVIPASEPIVHRFYWDEDYRNDDNTGWKLICEHCAQYNGFFINIIGTTVAHCTYALPGDITGFIIPFAEEAIKEANL